METKTTEYFYPDYVPEAKTDYWTNYETLVSEYIWSRIYNPNVYIPSGLLQMKDRRGLTPAIFISVSFEAGPGKTTSYGYKLLYDFFSSRGKCLFGLWARKMKECGSVAEGVFKSTLKLFFPEYSVFEKKKMNGTYSEIYIVRNNTGETKLCGYVLPVASADELRKISSKFCDIYQTYFDEFQPMDDSDYLPDEPKRFLRAYDGLGRGNNITSAKDSPTRVVPIYMASNTMSVINDYFLAFGISNKIQPNTKRYKGDGVVLEVCRVKGLKEKHAMHPVHIAFTSGDTVARNLYKDDRWLNDNRTNVIKAPKSWGDSYYVCTIAIGDQRYGVRYFGDCGIWYIDYRTDKSCLSIYTVFIGDNVNLPLLKAVKVFDNMKKALKSGSMYFASPVCKKAVMAFIR